MTISLTDVQIQNEKGYDELFETYLRPLKSKNARMLFRLFLGHQNVDYLTTLDLQIKLDELGFTLSKKEINGWLSSLLEAGLIAKDDFRGKPTTISYEDKYTFDMWRLTSKGLEIAEGVNGMLNIKFDLPKYESLSLEGIAAKEKNMRLQILNHIEEIHMQITLMRLLSRAGGILSRSDMKRWTVPPYRILEKMVTNLKDLGLIKEVKDSRTTGFLSRFLRLIGLSNGRDVSFQLTREGKRLTEKFSPS